MMALRPDYTTSRFFDFLRHCVTRCMLPLNVACPCIADGAIINGKRMSMPRKEQRMSTRLGPAIESE